MVVGGCRAPVAADERHRRPAVTLGVLAYPLAVQFFGPQSYHGLPQFVRNFGADLGSFTAYSTRSVAGSGCASRQPSKPTSTDVRSWSLVYPGVSRPMISTPYSRYPPSGLDDGEKPQ